MTLRPPRPRFGYKPEDHEIKPKPKSPIVFVPGKATGKATSIWPLGNTLKPLPAKPLPIDDPKPNPREKEPT